MSCPAVDTLIEPAQSREVIPNAIAIAMAQAIAIVAAIAQLFHCQTIETWINTDFEEQGKLHIFKMDFFSLRIGGLRFYEIM